MQFSPLIARVLFIKGPKLADTVEKLQNLKSPIFQNNWIIIRIQFNSRAWGNEWLFADSTVVSSSLLYAKEVDAS